MLVRIASMFIFRLVPYCTLFRFQLIQERMRVWTSKFVDERIKVFKNSPSLILIDNIRLKNFWFRVGVEIIMLLNFFFDVIWWYISLHVSLRIFFPNVETSGLYTRVPVDTISAILKQKLCISFQYQYIVRCTRWYIDSSDKGFKGESYWSHSFAEMNTN